MGNKCMSGFNNSILSILACLAVNVTTDVTTQEWNDNFLAKHSTHTSATLLCFDFTSEWSCRILKCDCFKEKQSIISRDVNNMCN